MLIGKKRILCHLQCSSHSGNGNTHCAQLGHTQSELSRKIIHSPTQDVGFVLTLADSAVYFAQRFLSVVDTVLQLLQTLLQFLTIGRSLLFIREGAIMHRKILKCLGHLGDRAFCRACRGLKLAERTDKRKFLLVGYGKGGTRAAGIICHGEELLTRALQLALKFLRLNSESYYTFSHYFYIYTFYTKYTKLIPYELRVNSV